MTWMSLYEFRKNTADIYRRNGDLSWISYATSRRANRLSITCSSCCRNSRWDASFYSRIFAHFFYLPGSLLLNLLFSQSRPRSHRSDGCRASLPDWRSSHQRRLHQLFGRKAPRRRSDGFAQDTNLRAQVDRSSAASSHHPGDHDRTRHRIRSLPRFHPGSRSP